VELSPSDIAVAGQEAIESRARAIFRALAMLTKVVIIFDEFEPVLLSRKAREEDRAEERNIFTFLTPGMLPKLTRLHEAAEQQGVVYYLVTNHLEKLDEAAIREGRFDQQIGIYPPDPLSRAGAFQFALSRHVPKMSGTQRRRFNQVIRSSSGLPPHRLALKWFRPPRAGQPSNAWSFVVEKQAWDVPDTDLREPSANSPAEHRWLFKWEAAVREGKQDTERVIRFGPQ
jgi:hypothetical protein